MNSQPAVAQPSPFGVDGVRGRVGVYPITPDFALKLGWALGCVLRAQPESKLKNQAVLGKDTRISSYLFETAIQAGLISSGFDVLLLGPMPTPGVAWLTRSLHARAGIMISASHNPCHDNGIKLFGHDGQKIAKDFQHRLEAQLQQPLSMGSDAIGKPHRINDAKGRYIEFCKRSVPESLSLSGMKIAVDCANGAAYQIAPQILREFGAEVFAIGVDPNGYNINEGCGSTAPQALQAETKRLGADIGLALDGDADRIALVDENGELLDGDEVLYIMARHRRALGKDCPGIVGTVMSNLGLKQALKGFGVAFESTPVGDKHVNQRMRDLGWPLGGEPSGHIICGDISSTGDGVIAALTALHAMVDAKKTLSELKQGCIKYPQIVVNVDNCSEIDLVNDEKISSAVQTAERELKKEGPNGRVLLRRSGTESLIRIMVEGESKQTVIKLAHNLAATVRSTSAG